MPKTPKSIHVTAAWDAVVGEYAVVEATDLHITAVHADTSGVFHDMLLRVVPPRTTIFVTHTGDATITKLRCDPPSQKAH